MSKAGIDFHFCRGVYTQVEGSFDEKFKSEHRRSEVEDDGGGRKGEEKKTLYVTFRNMLLEVNQDGDWFG